MFTTWKADDQTDVLAADNSYRPAGPVSQALSTIQRNAATSAGEAGKTYSIINEWLTMRGELESDGDILVKGRVFGNIRCKVLIVDQGAHVEGGITAEELTIRGLARGTIKVKRVKIEKTATVDGEITQEFFSVEEGARMTGTLKSPDIEKATPIQRPADPGEDSPEKKVTSALYQILDGARGAREMRSDAAP